MILYYILVPFAWLLWHIGFRIHVEGRENLKKVQTKGCILAPTHVSAIDPVFIVVTRWGRRMIVFAKKELFEINALLTWFFRCCGAVCVRGTKDEMAAIEQTVEKCRNGETLLIFPEGTRGKTPSELELGEFHNGSFKMATKTGCPIIPLSISGSRNILEAHFPKIRGTHVTMTYGKPILPGELTKEEKKEIGNYTKNILLEQLKENPAR